LRRHLHIQPGKDTDEKELFTIEPVACLGCCTLAPVVRIGHSTSGHVTSERAPQIISEFLQQDKEAGSAASTLAQEVSIPDPGLTAAIRDALNKPSGPLTEQDLLGLTNLDARHRNIGSLQGLEAVGASRVAGADAIFSGWPGSGRTGRGSSSFRRFERSCTMAG